MNSKKHGTYPCEKPDCASRVRCLRCCSTGWMYGVDNLPRNTSQNSAEIKNGGYLVKSPCTPPKSAPIPKGLTPSSFWHGQTKAMFWPLPSFWHIAKPSRGSACSHGREASKKT